MVGVGAEVEVEVMGGVGGWTSTKPSSSTLDLVRRRVIVLIILLMFAR